MAQQIINVGTSLDSGDGDDIRTAFIKSNANFTELYNILSVMPVPLVTSVAGRVGDIVLTVADIDGALTESEIDALVTNRVTQSVTAAISPILGNVPSSLNSLEKIAAAINNNPSFYTTLTADLAGKLSLSGGTMTGPILFPASYQPSVANAAATKGYVDTVIQNIGVAPATTTRLGIVRVGSGLTIDTSGVLATEVGTLQLNALQTTLVGQINTKADKATTYTKAEVDALFEAASTDVDLIASVNSIIDLLNGKVNSALVYTRDQIDSLLADKVSRSELVSSGSGTISTDMSAALLLKADKATTYTKSEVDALIAGLNAQYSVNSLIDLINTKADASSVYTKTQTDALLSDKASTASLLTAQTNLTTLIGTKADTTSVYTKSQTDALLSAKASVVSVTNLSNALNSELATKANTTDVYTKTQSDALLADKASTASVTNLSNTTTAALATKADKATTYTKPEVDALFQAASTDQDLINSVNAIEDQLALKADKVSVYDKVLIDSLLAAKASVTSVTSLENSTTAALATKAPQATTYTKTEVDGLLSVKVDEDELIAAVNAILDLFESGQPSKIAVSEIDANNTLTNVTDNVTAIRFDRETGFNVQQLSPGEVKISLGSTFKTWLVDGQESLVAVGEDTVKFVAGNGINITTDPHATIKTIQIAATSSVKTFSFVNSMQWVVQHNMNTTNFVESLYDVYGNRFFASVTIIDNNSFSVNLTDATTGTVSVVF